MNSLFERESVLVQALLPSLVELFPRSGALVFAPEVTHHSRVVDLVVCEAGDPREAIPDWAAYGRAMRSLGKRHLSVLSLIWSEGAVAPDRLARMTWMSREALESEYLAPLLGAGLIDRRRSGAVIPTSWASWDVETIVAIEAKLTDWRNVVKQASENALWADYSYLAMPDDGTLLRDAVSAAVRSAPVGAIAVHPVDGSRIVTRAKRGALTSRRRRSQFATGLLSDMLSGGRWAQLT